MEGRSSWWYSCVPQTSFRTTCFDTLEAMSFLGIGAGVANRKWWKASRRRANQRGRSFHEDYNDIDRGKSVYGPMKKNTYRST